MTDEQLQEMRSRIAEVEDEFSRRANIPTAGVKKEARLELGTCQNLSKLDIGVRVK